MEKYFLYVTANKTTSVIDVFNLSMNFNFTGTGTNASYVEKIENVGTYEDKSKPYMIITTEWGNFGSDGVLNDIWTEIDRQLDNASLRPGSEM